MAVILHGRRDRRKVWGSIQEYEILSEPDATTLSDAAESIGRLCMSWSNLEETIWCVAFLHVPFKAPIDHTVFEAELDIRAKIALARNMCFRYSPQHMQSDLEYSLSFVDNKLRPARNRYVHDTYFGYNKLLYRVQRTSHYSKEPFQSKELRTSKTNAVNQEHLVCAIDAAEAVHSFLVTYRNRVEHIEGRHVEVDPESYMVDDVINATEESYQSATSYMHSSIETYLTITN